MTGPIAGLLEATTGLGAMNGLACLGGIIEDVDDTGLGAMNGLEFDAEDTGTTGLAGTIDGAWFEAVLIAGLGSIDGLGLDVWLSKGFAGSIDGDDPIDGFGAMNGLADITGF